MCIRDSKVMKTRRPRKRDHLTMTPVCEDNWQVRNDRFAAVAEDDLFIHAHHW